MVALGEMASLFPVAGGFTHYAARFVDPALGFATGVNYWYSYAIVRYMYIRSEENYRLHR